MELKLPGMDKIKMPKKNNKLKNSKIMNKDNLIKCNRCGR